MHPKLRISVQTKILSLGFVFLVSETRRCQADKAANDSVQVLYILMERRWCL